MNKTLIACTLVTTLIACGKHETAPPAPAAAPPPPAPKPLASGLDRAGTDAAARPQDDFYRHVNGGWLAHTEIPAEKAGYGSFDIVFDQAETELKAIIEAAALNKNAAGSEAQKVGDFYASFMDDKRREEVGLKPLAAEFARIDALKDKRELPALIAHLHRIGVDAPYNATVHQDNRDSTQYIVDFAQSGLGMPDRDYFLDQDAKFAQLRKDYLAHVQKTLALIGVKDSAQASKNVMAFETALAAKQWDKVTTRDPIKVYNKLDLAALKALMAGYDWPAYLNAAEVGSPAVIVSEPSYFGALDGIIKSTSLDTLKNYFKLRTLDAFASALNQAVYDEFFDFNRAKLYGVKEQRPRWKRGIAVTDGALGEAVGKLFVEQHFPAAHKARMQQLVQNLLKAYDAEFAKLDWMSAQSQKAASAKLAKFMTKIGYPDQWRDYAALSIARDDLFGNVLRASEFEYLRNIHKLGKPVDRAEWGMTPQTVNAYYNPELNEIVFPAAILRPPFFNAEADDAVNYGAIGAIIGHEISHGFDDQGSQYDGAGNLKDWWSGDDRKKFEAKTHALAAQYDRYEPVKGFHVNGALTLGENIADLGGITIAHKAYQISLGGKPAPVIDGLSGDQRFFLGYAQAWREKMRDEAVINQVKSDPHSPPEYRCNGVVVNVPEFYSTFAVKPGDGMYLPPEQRIAIW